MKRQAMVFLVTCITVMILVTPILSHALEVDDTAPNFTGHSTQGDIQLTDYAGKQHVVLALYFAVFTPV